VRYDRLVTIKVEWIETVCGCGCGVTFRQLRDPGKEREYLNNAHKQRAYRARNPHKNHSGTRAETPGARRRREEREAWASEEARREKERQRSYRRRYGFTPPPPTGVPSWCFPVTGEPARKARARDRAYKLYTRSLRPTHEGDGEAATARQRAEEIRVEWQL
jgi:hypothetical protein